MTYSIVARDEQTGQMGVACQSQAFAVGSSVPWALPGFGIVATQSMGEPMYGELGLDNLRAGLRAPEALKSLRAVDPYPERRQVAMIDGSGHTAVYTGSQCVPQAGHQVGDGCVALANMAASDTVWGAMVAAYEQSRGPLAERLVAALRAAEEQGGDFRGRRSASIAVVREDRSGRPWHDEIVDLRVDASADPVGELGPMVLHSERYHRMVSAFEAAVDGDPKAGMAQLERLEPVDVGREPDLCTWKAVVLALDGRVSEARNLLEQLAQTAPQFVELVRRFDAVGLLGDAVALDGLLPPVARS
jgi:uncharacterized Ntn-hydrolase superfamily protein